MINLEKDNALYENEALLIIYPNYGKDSRNYGELFDFLSDYDIITASEIGDDVIVMSGIVFFFREYDEIELSKKGLVELKKFALLENFINFKDKCHLTFYKWYHGN
ncbi:MAG: hypothetical protein ACK4NY_12935 [Spirosomataceae bacterium]